MNLILGTAMWTWTTPKEVCFQLLDKFYEKGFREVDSATNYPINKNPDDFRAAERILEEWIRANGISDLKVMMKIGSINNMRTPDNNLSESFILMNLDEYKFKFGDNLQTLMIHWDNREDMSEIKKTFNAFQIVHNQGFKVGLSGIKYPGIYRKIMGEHDFDFRIQMKHNLLYSDYERYKVFHGKKRFITYGINAGGIKLDLQKYHENSSLKARGGETENLSPIAQKVSAVIQKMNENSARPKITSFNQVGMIYAFHNPDVDSILIGPSKIEQLQSTTDFFEVLRKDDYSDVFSKLKNL